PPSVPALELSGRPPTDDAASAFVLALVDVAEHPLALLGADLRALDVAHVGGIAVGHVAETLGGELDAFVVTRSRDHQPRGHHATLPTVGAHAGDRQELRFV